VIRLVPKIVILQDPRIPKYIPVFGWKRWIPNWLLSRDICFIVEGNIAYCHPDNMKLIYKRVYRRDHGI